MTPEPFWTDGQITIHHGDVLEVLPQLPEASVDAICTDPPYGLEFMGKEWDGADGFRRSLNPADTGRDNVFGRTSRKAPEYRTSGAGQRGQPGIGERPTEWVSNQGWNGFRCRNCGHLAHGGSPCGCEKPDFVRADNRWPLFQEWCEAWAAECLRVLKPGGHLVSFGGTRTWHRLACAIEDAGFEIRDSVADLTGISGPGLLWMYGQGMPKSLDVSKAIDKAAGAERKVVGEGARFGRGAHQNRTRVEMGYRSHEVAPEGGVAQITAPATSEAAQWEGWGTGLRPSWEPVVVARKPLAGTVAQNVLTHGTGALNIDACRLAPTGESRSREGEASQSTRYTDRGGTDFAVLPGVRGGDPDGRWPPNAVLAHSPECTYLGAAKVKGITGTAAGKMAGKNADVYGKYGGSERAGERTGYVGADGTETVEAWECVPGCPVSELDRQSGVLTSGANPTRRAADKFRDTYGEFAGQAECTPHRGADSGGASRFFPVFKYNAKARQDERPRLEDGTAWPTVKPVDLMRWLVRLVTPPGGTILDPFAGSGTTAEAAIIEGFNCILIDKDPTAVALIRQRLRKDIQPDLFGGGGDAA